LRLESCELYGFSRDPAHAEVMRNRLCPPAFMSQEGVMRHLTR